MKMTDAEKGLRQHCEGSMLDRCGECPYHEPDYNNPCAGIDCRDKLIIDIAELMKAQEQPKMGNWTVLTDCANSGVYCSECNNKIFENTAKPKDKLLKYCSNCGAKMAPWELAVWL